MTRELTPRQLAKLASQAKSMKSLRLQLRLHGYKRLNVDGAFKEIYRYPKGRYVVKLGNGGPHTNGFKIRARYLKDRRRCIPPLAWGRTWHVQRFVKECRCDSPNGLDKYPDSSCHNHTHTPSGFARIFDY